MYPINQVFLGNEQPFTNVEDLDFQIRKLEEYKNKLNNLQKNNQKRLIWDNIDTEISSMSESQQIKLYEDSEYLSVYGKIQIIVQRELLNLVKEKIENSQEGKELLNIQLETIKKLKNKIIKEQDKEIESFKKFKEFSKNNPNITYEEFLKHTNL
jgi:hypothetical protein